MLLLPALLLLLLLLPLAPTQVMANDAADRSRNILMAHGGIYADYVAYKFRGSKKERERERVRRRWREKQ